MTGSPLREAQAPISGPWEPDAYSHDSCLPSVTSTETNWTDTYPGVKAPWHLYPQNNPRPCTSLQVSVSVHSQLCSVWSFPLMSQKTDVFLLSPPRSAPSLDTLHPRGIPMPEEEESASLLFSLLRLEIESHTLTPSYVTFFPAPIMAVSYSDFPRTYFSFFTVLQSKQCCRCSPGLHTWGKRTC